MQQAAALTIEPHPKMAGFLRGCGFFRRLNPQGIAIHIPHGTSKQEILSSVICITETTRINK
jgi:hypothetical protein